MIGVVEPGLVGLLLLLAGAALVKVCERLERTAKAERPRWPVPFGPAPSNCRPIEPPYDWENDRG